MVNPANGAPITVPAQDMVLGLYYITKLRKGAKGEGLTFYGPDVYKRQLNVLLHELRGLGLSINLE